MTRTPRKYEVGLARKVWEYARITVVAHNKDEAKRIALRLARELVEPQSDAEVVEWCDSSPAKGMEAVIDVEEVKP